MQYATPPGSAAAPAARCSNSTADFAGDQSTFLNFLVNQRAADAVTARELVDGKGVLLFQSVHAAHDS
jgi:hypothetical protein